MVKENVPQVNFETLMDIAWTLSYACMHGVIGTLMKISGTLLETCVHLRDPLGLIRASISRGHYQKK